MSLNGRDAYERNYRPHLPPDVHAPILDVGCGFGDFLAFLQECGYENLRGVEIDMDRVKASVKRTRAPVDHAEDLESYLRERPETYALITLKSVIAHFPRARAIALLRAMRDALAPGGTLVVETFNASRWTGPYVLYNDITHEWAYTEHSLRQILEAGGLRVVDLTGERLSATKISTWIFHAAQRLWSRVLMTMYLVERGIGNNPTILSKYLVAVCRRD